jgi:hypothetical protein
LMQLQDVMLELRAARNDPRAKPESLNPKPYNPNLKP